ncbi:MULTISPECIES: DUF1059 domain-containing protein [Gordonia]|uniref:DUF1059 domain-containing protein n=1 Tax=Gordonia sputi NBRC 100414 TaxID=1089453 RepID=H5U572_9ACTN|nr:MULTISPECIES: DUF1059 domain-containing protein [Gordonia]NKY91870.1 DUF1059 domain-containing protein [Gordonia sputi]OBA43252.1 DUF1059 domain-containing protein [Gordonia sp. 852002-51296_SCH5728562-b]OBC08502.1 DUF1059 domain-containing protein [Gordonia sp. 852002-50395_SCH5434458]GAB40880.1 hypothetical protein GOSPT_117_00040 [Gordonia sputi NBRC 100414]
MKSFWCGAVIPDCDATFEATTEAEIVELVVEHAADDHGIDDVPPDTVARVREVIVDQ